MLLYIVRHGDPNYKDDCLTDFGKVQAEAVAKKKAEIAAAKAEAEAAAAPAEEAPEAPAAE